MQTPPTRIMMTVACSPSPVARARAVRVLAKNLDESVLALLREMMGREKDPRVLWEIKKALAVSGREEFGEIAADVAETILEMMTREEEPLSEVSDVLDCPKVQEVLLRALQNPSTKVRRTAAKTIWYRGMFRNYHPPKDAITGEWRPVGVAFLVERLWEEEDPGVCDYIVRSLGDYISYHATHQPVGVNGKSNWVEDELRKFLGSIVGLHSERTPRVKTASNNLDDMLGQLVYIVGQNDPIFAARYLLLSIEQSDDKQVSCWLQELSNIISRVNCTEDFVDCVLEILDRAYQRYPSLLSQIIDVCGVLIEHAPFIASDERLEKVVTHLRRGGAGNKIERRGAYLCFCLLHGAISDIEQANAAFLPPLLLYAMRETNDDNLCYLIECAWDCLGNSAAWIFFVLVNRKDVGSLVKTMAVDKLKRIDTPLATTMLIETLANTEDDRVADELCHALC